MKNRLIPLLMLLLATTLAAKANPVDMRTAREVAVKFVNANTRIPLRGTEDLQLVTTYRTESDDAAFHIFNTPNGFVIVSADDCATPILGYSDEGRPFDLENVPIQLQEYLQDFVEQIQYGIENHVQDEATERQWQMVRSVGHIIDQRSTAAVAPLLTDTWSQGCYYNNLCPVDPSGSCGHVVTGCVATSFAQIMHYWGYPINGMGSHTYTPPGYPEQTVNFSATTYDWANMPNSLSSSSSSTQVNAVATLMWHCGVAVNMGYGPGASGAASSYVASALLYYFGYSDELSIVYRSNYNNADWLALMKNCLNLGCPIHYSGSNANGGGHAFVCDGYNSNDLLHFNWGWSGAYNGYFSIDALNPGSHSYNLYNMAIINIHPSCTYGTTYQITATTDSSICGTVSGSGTYNCGDVCTLTATANAGYGFMYWTENDEPVSTEATYSFIAMNDRNLVAHFAPPFNIGTSVSPIEGGTVTGGGLYYYNQHVTLTAIPNEGYVFDKWTKDGVDYSYLSTLSMNVTEAAEYTAYFEPMAGIEIGEAMTTNIYLPTYNFYSLTQQIYTAEEMGGAACQISSVSFFNTGLSINRNLAIYMVNTTKTAFNDANDWIAVTQENQVFNGSVTMAAKGWTTIYFATPFSFDGSSNVALIIDDNSNTYNYGYMNCRTFSTDESQAIRINGSDTDYDPYNPSAYTGTLIKYKNHVVFGIPSYDYTVTATVNPTTSGTVNGGGACYLNQPITLKATPNAGYVFNNWTKDGAVVSYLSTYTFPVTESAEYVANFEAAPNSIVIGNPNNTSYYLPTYYYYSLSEQIYTSSEMGGVPTEISSVSFFNAGNYNYGITRNMSIYIVNTDKTSFDSVSDWISVTESDLVFSGNVTFTAHDWATVYFSKPFNYDGSSNVALIVDDNTNSYYASTSCRTFVTEGNQAIRVSSSGTNFDPANPSGYTGMLMSMKNQVIFGIPSYDYTITATANPSNSGTMSGGGPCYLNQPITLTATPNEGYVFNNWTKDGTVVSYLSTYSLTVTESAEYVANFQEVTNGIAIGDATYTNSYLPINSYYSLSEQIYTANEMGGTVSQISSVSFFNTGTYNLSRTMSVYMVSTDKTSFDSISDWIPVSENDMVFNGNVIFNARGWTTIYFSTPFNYNGTSNVALIVDDNSNGYNSYTSCRTFMTGGNQAIRISGSGTNYDPTNPSGNTGTLMSMKNQVIFGIPSYDYTVTATANPSNSGTMSGGGACYLNQPITLTATPNEGYVFNNWTKNGTVVSYLPTYTLTVTESTEYVANFEAVPNSIVIGSPTNTNAYLPTYSYYSLSEQIYTANEMGETACQISSVSFFNTGATNKTRTMSIYMVSTDKTVFDSISDWIPVSENDMVFSGNVTFTAHGWSTIYFSTPFNYDGTSNVALIVDDNSNSNNTSTSCRTFVTVGSQAIRISGSGTNYDPTNPSGNTGTLMSMKNQVVFGLPSYDYTITATANPTTGGTVSGGGPCFLNQPITLTATHNAGYVFNNWTKDGEVVSYLSNFTLTVTESAEYVANFEAVSNSIVIGSPTNTNAYLPTYSYYSLSEQIYTANEMGGTACQISSVSFFNTGTTNRTRTMSIYMVNTDKTVFDSVSDWIPVTENDLVFSGNVVLPARDWATIFFSTPFNYDGFSNVALIVDDNSNSYNTSTSCRTFMTDGNQVIRISGSGTNYDPSNPSGYTGTLMSMKNQVVFCLPSYDYTITATANPSTGGTVSGGGLCYLNQPITITATASEGYIFSNWTKNGEVVSYLSRYNLTVTESVEYVANFEMEPDGIIIGDGTYANSYLPSYYYYSLSEQIYTAEEMNSGACEISSVSFFNTSSSTITRNMSVYMVNTDKTSFDSISDWIPVSENDLVFSGNVSFTARGWSTCYFSTPFNYDGSSNVALIVDDNSNSYNTYIYCRTFSTEGSQALRIYGSGTNYNPCAPTGYTGSLMPEKNQVIFGIPSYDYTVTVSVGSDGGGIVSGGGLCYLNQPITLTATPNEGYVFINWTKNGTVMSCLSNYTLPVTESAEYVAHFQEVVNGFVIGDATNASYYLPTYSYYSLSEQIYTAAEMGGEAVVISSVSLFNTGTSNRTRNMNIYMVNTDKTSFENTTDWIPVTENDLVFSGNVTFTARDWVNVYLSTPFNYDGSSNVALIVDDNSNSYNTYIYCRTFSTEGNQALRIYGSGTNYDPCAPTGYTGTLMSMKNQVIFRWPSTVTATANPTGGGTISGYGSYAYGATCTLTATPNAGYYFLNWTEDGTVVSYDANYSFAVTGDRNLVANFMEGESTCTISFDLYDSYNNGWSGNYLVVDYGNGNTEQLTLESGSSISYSREVATGSTIALSWIAGTYTYQCSFDVKFENGVPLYHGAGLNSSFQKELYINCAVASAPHVIAAVAEPEEGGTVEGSGTYDGGTAITLTATPNDGYSFCFWSENGQQVSTNASYSFVVTSDRNLVARFSLPLTVSVSTNMALGGTVTGFGMFYYGNTCTLTATPNEGYLFLNWSKNGAVVSCNATYSFTVTEDTDLEAVFMPLEGTLIGQGESTNYYLPSISGYNYTLSQQIYMPNEIGEAGNITSISYFNAGVTQTRTYDIYMMHTDKTTFENATDWITVSEADRVYSGSVTITQGYWTTIDLDTPFAYNGTSNLAIIVDDNTGTWSNGMACRVFNSNGSQAIRVYSDGINYDPYNPSGYNGTRYYVKNQIILGFTSLPTFTKEISAYTENGGYYLISVPVDEVAPTEVEHMLDNSYDLYAFDESQELEWLNYKNTDNGFADLVAGKGYLYANSNEVTLSFVGTLYSGNGDVTLSKTGDAETAGWNLVGNPFADTAYLDRDFYVMNEEGSEIVAADRDYIEPMEGVFVIATENGETLTFSTTAPAKSPRLVLNLNSGHSTSSGTAIIDRAIIRFTEGHKLPKLQIKENNSKLFIRQNDKDYAVVNSDDEGEMLVGFKTGQGGTYSLSFSYENVDFSYLQLIDTLTGADIDLLQQPSYTFSVSAQAGERHFKLFYKQSE